MFSSNKELLKLLLKLQGKKMLIPPLKQTNKNSNKMLVPVNAVVGEYLKTDRSWNTSNCVSFWKTYSKLFQIVSAEEDSHALGAQ